MKKINLQKLLKDRKTLYLVLTIMIVSVFTLSIAYASLSTILEISGNAQISSAEWDIHLDNVRVKDGSVSANTPQISGTSTLSFDVDLNMPGDFYEFTVDVVNLGNIDAEIDSVVKTPELTSEQAKYIKYEVTYENGDSISTEQVLESSSSTPIKVRLEYRKDIAASDLPSSATELSLKLTLVYVQSDGSGSSNGSGGSSSVVRVVSGDGTQVGNEVCIKNECFYVISSTDSAITMLSKYNLHVGNIVTWDGVSLAPVITSLESPTGIQDKTAKGNVHGATEWYGTTAFSSNSQKGTNYSDYSGSIVEGYVNNYNSYLITQGVTPIEARLITNDELIGLGCSEDDLRCSEAPSWVYATSYWSGSAYSTSEVWFVGSYSYVCFDYDYHFTDADFGVRPVITISRSLI